MLAEESDEIRLKRYEKLFEYSKDTFDFYLKRGDESDAKIARFITMLLALLGAGVFNVRRAAAIAAANDWLVHLWLAAYVLFGICAIASFGFFLRALYYQRIQAPVSDESVVLPFFEESKYVDVLVGLSKSYLTSANEAASAVRMGYSAGHLGYLFFIASLALGLLSAAGYAIVSAESPDGRSTRTPNAIVTAGCPRIRTTIPAILSTTSAATTGVH